MKIAEEIRTLICDDIRNEVGGKLSLMGVYDDIILSQFPAVIPRLSFSIFLKGIKRDIYKIKSYIRMPNEKTIDIGNQNFLKEHAAKGKSINICLTVSPLVIEKDGHATWEIIFNDDDSTVIIHKFEIKLVKRV